MAALDQEQRARLLSHLTAMSVDSHFDYASEIESFRQKNGFSWDDMLGPASLPAKDLRRLRAFLCMLGSNAKAERNMAIVQAQKLCVAHDVAWDDILVSIAPPPPPPESRPLRPATPDAYTHVWQDTSGVNWPVTLTGQTSTGGTKAQYTIEVKLALGWIDVALEQQWPPNLCCWALQSHVHFQQHEPQPQPPPPPPPPRRGEMPKRSPPPPKRPVPTPKPKEPVDNFLLFAVFIIGGLGITFLVPRANQIWWFGGLLVVCAIIHAIKRQPSK